MPPTPTPVHVWFLFLRLSLLQESCLSYKWNHVFSKSVSARALGLSHPQTWRRRRRQRTSKSLVLARVPTTRVMFLHIRETIWVSLIYKNMIYKRNYILSLIYETILYIRETRWVSVAVGFLRLSCSATSSSSSPDAQSHLLKVDVSTRLELVRLADL